MTLIRSKGICLVRSVTELSRDLRASMSAVSQALVSSEKIVETAKLLSYRRAVTDADFEEIGRLRKRACLNSRMYLPTTGDMILETHDFEANAFVFGVYADEQLVSSLRISYLNADARFGLPAELFPDVFNPLVDQGLTFIDPSRLAVDAEAGRDLPGLALLTLRLGHIATAHFDADYCLAVIKHAHSAFYRRVFKATMLASPKRFDHYSHDVSMFGGAHASLPSIAARYPVFNFDDRERMALYRDGTVANEPMVRPSCV